MNSQKINLASYVGWVGGKKTGGKETCLKFSVKVQTKGNESLYQENVSGHGKEWVNPKIQTV